MLIAVVGKGRNCPEAVAQSAFVAGQVIGGSGHGLVTGGLGGVMHAAAYGARLTFGAEVWSFLPVGRYTEASPFATAVIRTGLAEAGRNVVIGSCCDAMLALAGSHGTLQELAVALDRGVPVAAFRTDNWAALGLHELVLREDLEEWVAEVGAAHARLVSM